VITLTLRAKTTAFGALVALLLAVVTSLSTYLLARQYMLQQRNEVAVTQVLAASRLAASAAAIGADGLTVLSAGAQVLPGSRAVLYRDGEWLVSAVGLSQDDLPPSLLQKLAEGLGARQRGTLRDEPIAVVGFPLVEQPRTWFIGVLSMQELARTLVVLRGALIVGVLLTTVGGAGVGWLLSRRVMEPLHVIGDTAQAISKGDLKKQISEPQEPDLARIALAFNEMTDSLRTRIDREARFSATVSHELKSPLTVIKGAAELIAAKRDELPPRAQLGVDLMTSQIEEFEKILNDLIEMSRYQSGHVQPQLEVLSASQAMETMAHRHGIDLRAVEVEDADVIVDVRRLEQIFVNLKKNADLYANGIEAIRGERNGTWYEMHFDDAGIGVAPMERERIFEPFVRGKHHSAVPGSGLGLAITREHARSMGGDLCTSVSPEGGARFSLKLCIAEDMS
jgi:signal transduction histidine kinase